MKKLLTAIALLMVIVVAACESPERVYDMSPTPGSQAVPSRELSASPRTPAAGQRPILSRISTIDGRVDRGWLDDFATSPADELWVIVQPEHQPLANDDDMPRAGSLVVPNATGFAALPLESTAVTANITGLFAGVDVHQSFVNPYAEKIEAVYAFPIPQDASVTGFVMTAGTRTIRAVVREREDAEKMYYAARAAGKNAALLTQERPNIFTQRVANIEPGKSIDIDISYFHAVTLADGWCEWVFPMTIAPRFTPPSAGYGKSIGRRNSVQPTGLPPITTADPSALHRVSIDLAINAGATIEELGSPTHAIARTQDALGRWRVSLNADAAPDRDFILRYRVAGSVPQAGVALADGGPGNDGGYFALTLYPPLNPAEASTRPLEMIFLLDRSGSMKGSPFDQAVAAIDYALGQLSPADTFQIVSFSNDVTRFASAPVSASREMITQGRKHLHDLVANGGTMAMQGIDSAFAQRSDRQRTRVVVLLSDGQVSNESEIIGRVHDTAGDACVFSFGIGDAPNRFLMDRIARMGGGAAAYIGNGMDAVEPMRLFLERVSTPVLTDLRIDYGSLAVRDVVPDRLPDLWLGRPITVVGRTRDGIGTIRPGVVTVSGRVNGVARRIEIPIDPSYASGSDSLPNVWARRKIMHLADEATYRSPGSRQREIQRLALDFGLASPFTAFVAVDAMSRTSGGHGTTVVQPQAIPHGTRYETSADR